MDISEGDGLTFGLVTARLRLRPLTQADAPDLARIGGDARVARMFKSILAPWPAAALYDWIDKAQWTGSPGYRLGICLPDGALIGTVGFGGEPLEVGYFLAADQVGQGYATEATYAVLADAFARFKMDAVVAEHFEDNPSSGHVLRKLGFVQVGQGMSQSGGRPAPAPCSHFRLTRDAFVQAGAHDQLQGAGRMPIQTERLVLRPMAAADAPLFHALVTRPEVARMLFIFRTDWPLAEAAPFIEAWRWQGKLRFRLAITLNDEWIGWIGADDATEPEVFYALRPECAGQGLMQEALRGFCRFLFARFAPDALQAGAFIDNPASAAVLRHCGFERRAEVMGRSAGRNAPAPEGRFRLLRADLRA